MATIKNTVTMQDRMTPVLRTIIKSLQSTVNAMAGVDHVSNTSFRRAQRDVQAASEALDQFNNNLDEIPPRVDNVGSGFSKWKMGIIAANQALELGKKVVGAIANQLTDISGMTDQQSRLRAMLDEGEGVYDMQQLITRSAMDTRSAYEDTLESAVQMKAAMSEYGMSTQAAVRMSELMNKSLTLGGTKGAAAQSVMYNLQQSLATGQLRWEDWKIVASNSVYLADIVAKNVGVTGAQLNQMVQDGEISAADFTNALLEAGARIDEEFEMMPDTFTDWVNNIKTFATGKFLEEGGLHEKILEMLASDQFLAMVEGIKNAIVSLLDFLGIVLDYVLMISELIGNSDGFQTFSNNAVRGITWVANKTVDLMNLATDVVRWVKDNESTVKNVLYGIGAVLGATVIANTTAAGAAAIDMANKFQKAGKIFGVSFKTFGIIAVITLIATLILWIIDLYNTNEQFRNKVQQVWADYGDAIIATVVAVGAIFASIFFPTISAAIASTLTLMATTIKAGAAMVLTWIQVGLAFLAAHWWILLIVAAVTLAIYAWNNLGEVGKILAIIIGAIIAIIAIWIAVQWALNAALTANPIGVIIMAIAALIAIVITIILWIIKLWETNMDFKYGVIKIWNSILNFFEQVPIFFQWVGNGIADAFGWAKIQVLDILQSMANGVISIINDLIGLLNKIPGVAIDPIQQLTFATTAAAEEEASKQARADSLQASKDKAVASAAERDAKMAVDRATDEAALAKKRAEGEAEKQANEAKSNENDWSKYLDNQPEDIDWSKYAGAAANPTIAGGNLDSIGKIKDDVSITDEDIKLLKDVAQTEFINKFTTLRPEMQVSFGDVKETADVAKILEALEEMVEEAYASVLVGEGA